MNKEKYLADRQAMMDGAEQLIAAGKIDEANTKMKDIEKLDADFEVACLAQANLNAMKDKTKVTNIQNIAMEGQILGTLSNGMVADPEDMFDSVEYRKAFMNNVIKGSAIPAKFTNVDANTKTSDASAVIPTTVMERIIEKLESTGMILPLVTRTAYKGGLAIPTSSVKPVATWVAEGATSDKQKKTVATAGNITFAYHKLRCAISVSLETDTMALPVFETTFVNNVVEAMVKAQEQAIVSGTGEGQPKGILAETVVTGQNVDVAAADYLEYETLVNAEAALPLAYENGAVWFMTKKTFMSFIGMVDSTGQPISRVNYGIGGKPERSLLGRTVVLNDYMSSMVTTVVEDTIVAFLFNPKDYIFNTNYQMTIKKYEDNDTEDMVTKAIMLVDGKAVDVNSLVTITKKAA